MDKEKLWYYLTDTSTTKKQKFKMLDRLAETMYEKGWNGHKRLQRGIHTWTAQKMKEDFDQWYDNNIDRFPLKRLEEIQRIVYNHIPMTNPPKTRNHE